MPTKQYCGGCGLGVQWRGCGDVYEQWFTWLVTTGSTEAHLPAERCILRSAVIRPDDSTARAAVCTLDAENAREQEVGTPCITFFICPCTYTIMQKGSLVHARTQSCKRVHLYMHVHNHAKGFTCTCTPS
jgi:hypothetical protein